MTSWCRWCEKVGLMTSWCPWCDKVGLMTSWCPWCVFDKAIWQCSLNLGHIKLASQLHFFQNILYRMRLLWGQCKSNEVDSSDVALCCHVLVFVWTLCCMRHTTHKHKFPTRSEHSFSIFLQLGMMTQPYLNVVFYYTATTEHVCRPMHIYESISLLCRPPHYWWINFIFCISI